MTPDVTGGLRLSGCVLFLPSYIQLKAWNQLSKNEQYCAVLSVTIVTKIFSFSHLAL